MQAKRHGWWMGALFLVLCALAGLSLIARAQGGRPNTATALTRTLEPVILTGNQVPLFDGASVDDLFAYAYVGGSWQQIPFQLDEVDATGVYTAENGLLDANDELVFMAMDLGEEAGGSEWIADAEARNQPRYQVTVTNPLNPTEAGWVYLYRSATLVPTFPDYVDWDSGNDRVVAGTYVLGFDPLTHVSVDALELNGSGVDGLDRTKLRAEAVCWIGTIPLGLTLTEEDLPFASLLTPSVDGPVRVGGGRVDSHLWAYRSLYRLALALELGGFVPPPPCTSVEIEAIRLSDDWLDPTVSGMAPATYFDGNTVAGVPVDGTPDAVPATPAHAWTQVSGGQGSVVRVMDVAAGSGTVSNYYRDDGTVDPGDTGDGRSFGDAGLRVDDLSSHVGLVLLNFVLDPGQPNVGATYESYYANPLAVETAAQTYGPTFRLYLPLALRTWP